MEVDGEVFARSVAARLAPEAPRVALEELDGPGLYLACALEAGAAPAFAEFERALAPPLREALRRSGLPRPAVEDALDSVGEHVLWGSPERPARIREYSGRGPLGAWLRVVVMRLALKRARRAEHQAVAADAQLTAMPTPEDSPELALIKARHRAEFEAAFREALTRLTPQQRNLLRYHYLERLSTEQVALLCGVHRATAVRHLAQARRVLLQGTREALTRRLGIGQQQFDSFVRVIKSELRLTLPPLLGPDAPEGG